jgi:hypothetical protein
MPMYSCSAICASVRPWATKVTSSRSLALSLPILGTASGCCRPGAVSMSAYSAAVSRLIAAPRSSAARPDGPDRVPGGTQGFLLGSAS